MVEPSALTNGRFLHALTGWEAALGASYSAGAGDAHYGVAVLPTGGGSVAQAFGVTGARAFSAHVAVRAIGAALSAGQAQLIITDGAGNTVVTQDLSGQADVWTEQTYQFGLARGTTYTLELINASAAGDVQIDDVWLWWVPKTRLQLAAQVHRKLGVLASDAALVTTPAGDQTEGSYTDAIDAGLRAIGAIDPDTDLADIRYLTASLLDSCLAQIERGALELLQRYYATFVDTDEGPLKQKLSQIGAALKVLTGGGQGGSARGQVVIRTLTRATPDYEFDQ